MWRSQNNVSISFFLIAGLRHPPFCKIKIHITSMNALTDKHTSTYNAKFKNFTENRVWFAFLHDFFHWHLKEFVISRQLIILAFKFDVFSVFDLLWVSKTSDLWDTKVSGALCACPAYLAETDRNRIDLVLCLFPQITSVIFQLVKAASF